MVFVRAWDENAPADTLPANLYAQSLRQLKTDIRERMSAFGAGLKSTREVPEPVFGNANSGVTFFAEDEGKLYRWNGSAWSAISCEFQRANLTAVDVSATNIDGVIVSVPGTIIDALQVYSVDFYSTLELTSGSAAGIQWVVRFGGLNVLTVTSPFTFNVFHTRIVLGGPSATLTADNVFGYSELNGTLLAVHEGLSLDVTSTWDARLRSGSVPFGGATFRVHQALVRVTR